jgi:gamma-glutamylcyclotransferase (GGCT)/AIG2-like uncharacterized protein YtfP
VSLFNRALDLLERDGTEVDAARCLSDALSKIPAEWSRLASQEVVGEVETLQAMLGQALSSNAQAELLSSDAFEKAERDEAVGTTVIPVQSLLVNLLLDRPDERLVIYGTLAPGKPNHNVIEDLSGDYRDCSVHGRISEVDGLPYFTWAPSEASLEAQLFSSRQLPDKWDDLDQFEGDGYKRRLIPATVGDGLTVASIYMSTADDWWSSPGR